MRAREIIAESAKRVTVWSGATIPVLHNPSRAAFEAFAAKHRAIRGLITFDGKDLWLWNGAAAVHPNLMQELGLDRVDCVAFNDGIWHGPVHDITDEYKPAIQRISPKPVRKWGPKDDELLKQLFDDPLISEAKLVHASGKVKFGPHDHTVDIKIVEDPTFREIGALVEKSKTKQLRGFASREHIYVWDCMDEIHHRVRQVMGCGDLNGMDFWIIKVEAGIFSPGDWAAKEENPLRDGMRLLPGRDLADVRPGARLIATFKGV